MIIRCMNSWVKTSYRLSSMVAVLAVFAATAGCGRAQPPPSDVARAETSKSVPKADSPIFVWSGLSDSHGYLRVEIWGAGKSHVLVIKSTSQPRPVTHRGVLTSLPPELCTPLTAQVFARSDSEADPYSQFVPISAAIADDGSLRLYVIDGRPFSKALVLRPAN